MHHLHSNFRVIQLGMRLSCNFVNVYTIACVRVLPLIGLPPIECNCTAVDNVGVSERQPAEWSFYQFCPKFVAMATSLKEFEKEVQIDHLYDKSMVKV